MDEVNDPYAGLSQASRIFRLMDDMMVRYHNERNYAMRNDMAERLLLCSDLPNAIRIRSLIMLTDRPDDPESALECAREAVRLLDEVIRPSARANGHPFPEIQYDVACRALALATEEVEKLHAKQLTTEEDSGEDDDEGESERDSGDDEEAGGPVVPGIIHMPKKTAEGDDVFGKGHEIVLPSIEAASGEPMSAIDKIGALHIDDDEGDGKALITQHVDKQGGDISMPDIMLSSTEQAADQQRVAAQASDGQDPAARTRDESVDRQPQAWRRGTHLPSPALTPKRSGILRVFSSIGSALATGRGALASSVEEFNKMSLPQMDSDSDSDTSEGMVEEGEPSSSADDKMAE